MKKLISLLMSLLMIFTFSVCVFAEGEGESTDEPAEAVETALEIIAKTSNPYGTFNEGGKLSFEISLDILSVPESSSGVSIVVFELIYDEAYLAPGAEPAPDEDGDECDYSSLLKFGPEGWGVIGRPLDGVFELAVWDVNDNKPVTELSNITIKVPFDVLTDIPTDTITVGINAVVYDRVANECAVYATENYSFERAYQPDEIVNCPDNFIPLNTAGYLHAANNVIYYAEEDITIGEYIMSYMEITNNQQDMNYFAIAIFDAETNKVVYCDTVIGRPQSDKSGVVIPAGHYIIGVNGNLSGDFKTFTESIKVGMNVELFNVNVTAMDPSEPVTLEEAGFRLVPNEPVLKENANAVYDRENATLMVYDNDITAGELTDMFENDIAVKGVDGNVLGDDDKVATGSYLPFTEVAGMGIAIIIVGDVNSDGVVNQYDYILVKRHYFETYTLTGHQFKAACLNNGESVVIYDYIYIKRFYFGTLTPDAIMPR